jgi:hypothetical protein
MYDLARWGKPRFSSLPRVSLSREHVESEWSRVFLVHLFPSGLGYAYRRATRSDAVRILGFPLGMQRRRLRLWPLQIGGWERPGARCLGWKLNVAGDVAARSGQQQRKRQTVVASESRFLAGSVRDGTDEGKRRWGEGRAQLRYRSNSLSTDCR